MDKVITCAVVYVYVACTIFALLLYAGIRSDCSPAERQIIAMRVAATWPLALPVLPFTTAPIPGQPRACR